MKKVCVLGLGYIGLPAAVMLASCGVDVLGVDINKDYLDGLMKNTIEIEEPNLDNLLKQVLETKRLRLSYEPAQSDVYVIAVPTPFNEDKTCNLNYVLEAINTLIPLLLPGNLIIIESTVPPFTCMGIIKPLLEKGGFTIGEDIFLAHCPERVLPGRIMEEMIYNNRVIGGVTEACREKAAELYRFFVKGDILFTDVSNAEMTKLVENTFRDVNIAFVNEIVKICNLLNIDSLEVIRLANNHPRVNLHKPGPGVGGHCLAVDPYFIIEKAPDEAQLITMARKINTSMPKYITQAVLTLLDKVDNPRVAVLGVSYKGNTGDIRESPAIEIVELLWQKEIEAAVFDPYVKTRTGQTLRETVNNADLILILTDHKEFTEIDYNQLAGLMRTPIVLDTRNIISDDYSPSCSYKLYNLGNLFELVKK